LSYSPAYLPDDPKALAQVVRDELARIAQEFNAERASVRLQVLHAEPARPREGMVCAFDGTDYDPGSGEGIYVYRSGAWVFLG
jgi:hypothetical protein